MLRLCTSDASVYLDDRSNPADVLRSFYNAINRRECLRAYGYWDGPSLMTPLPDFIAQYDADATQSVTLTTDEALSEAEAAQTYSFVAATVMARLAGGFTQTFAGCYFLTWMVNTR